MLAIIHAPLVTARYRFVVQIVGRRHASADHGSLMYTNVPAINALCVIFRPKKLQRGRRGHDPALQLRPIMNCNYHGSIPSSTQWRVDHRQHFARIVSGDSPRNYNFSHSLSVYHSLWENKRGNPTLYRKYTKIHEISFIKSIVLQLDQISILWYI